MQDTLSIKSVIGTSIVAANLESTAKSFPRVASTNRQMLRRWQSSDGLSPIEIKVSHEPRTEKSNVQCSLFGLNATYARKDALSNVISTDVVTVNISSRIPSGVTLAEFKSAVLLLAGALLESNGAIIEQIYNGEY